MATMQALRIELEGEVASFRYPHFMWGVQPTFEMPPPATIYGHICSAVGSWIDPISVRFAYHFTHSGKFSDLEHIHAGGMVEPITSQARKRLAQQGISDVTMYGESTVTPFIRELLFRPRLTLYLDRLDLAPAFSCPKYAVVLGRSQDLCSYPPRAVQIVTLEEHAEVYYEHTLLPVTMAAERGVVVLMPRYVDYAKHRNPTFSQYVMLNDRIAASQIQFTIGEDKPVWCDPNAPVFKDAKRAIVWHSFVEN